MACSLYAFHTLFDQTVQISYAHVIPHLHSVGAANLYKWALSVLLILPQSFLLGMTFPLMSAGALRITSLKPGQIISLLYFTNSLGAAIGALASGFILVHFLGLPWTIRLAGLINIAIALSVWLLVRKPSGESPRIGAEKDKRKGVNGRLVFLIPDCLIHHGCRFLYL